MARLPRHRLAAALALCVLASAGLRVAASEPSGGTGGEAGRTGAIPEGDLAALQDHLAARRGHPVLLNFWATWCLPCLHEIPLLNDLQGRLGPTGLQYNHFAWIVFFVVMAAWTWRGIGVLIRMTPAGLRQLSGTLRGTLGQLTARRPDRAE